VGSTVRRPSKVEVRGAAFGWARERLGSNFDPEGAHNRPREITEHATTTPTSASPRNPMNEDTGPPVVDLEAPESIDWLRHGRQRHPTEIVTTSPEIPEVYVEAFGREAFVPPEGAQAVARRMVERLGDEETDVRGGSELGWQRAGQLAGGGPVPPQDVIQLAAWFTHHDKAAIEEAGWLTDTDPPWQNTYWTVRAIRGGDAAEEWATEFARRLVAFRRESDEADTRPEVDRAVEIYASVSEES
jgi:hypothetical protein